MSDFTRQTDPHVPELNDSDRDLCLLYLSGELGDGEKAMFDRRLETDARLGRELLAQANVICAAGTHVSLRHDSNPVTAGSSGNHSRRAIDGRRLVRVFAAVAASVLLACFLMIARDRHTALLENIDESEMTPSRQAISGMDDANRIAEAWANGPLRLSLESFVESSALEDSSETFAVGDPAAAIDRSDFEWMAAGVLTEADFDG